MLPVEIVLHITSMRRVLHFKEINAYQMCYEHLHTSIIAFTDQKISPQ